MRTHPVTAVALVILAALAASCASGDGDQSASPSGGEPTATATVPDATPEPTTTATTPPSGGDTEPEPAAGDGSTAEPTATVEEPSPTATATPTATPTNPPDRAGCPEGGTPWTDSPVATATTLLDGGDGDVTVHAVVHPHPGYEGNPWSQWGQGIVLDDGRHLSAIGDHLGADGNSYIYVYDHDSRELTMIADVLDLVDHEQGAWGYGKIHAQMVAGPCGDVYTSTYWGSRRDIEYGDGYEGDRLLRIDPDTSTVEDLGVVVDERGLPSMAATPDGRYLFVEAVEPESNSGTLVVIETSTGEVVHTEPGHVGFRSLAVDDSGRVLWTVGDGRLAALDPETGDVTRLTDEMPGRFLRAVAGPDEDGRIIAVTRNPEVFFSIDADGRIETLGDAAGYTTSMAFSPDGETVLYVPDAHGEAWEDGTPLLAFDPDTGRESVVVELNERAEEELGLRLGGTFSVSVDEARGLVYIGFNAGAAGEESFGEVVLVIVEIP